MNLMDNEIKPKKDDKTKKASRIILILMILLLIGIITIVLIMPFLKEKKLSIKLDGKEQADLKNVLQIQDDGQIYVPIRDIAQYLGYESYNGNYLNKSEDVNECYVESNQEVACFVADSNKIEKINKSNSSSSYVLADEETIFSDGKLYTTMDGIEKAFNVYFSYDVDNKKITIDTMQYLVDSYKSSVVKLGYTDISTNFEDEKAILNGLVIVKDSRNKFGILNLETNELLLETKYDIIEYMPAFNDFLVKSNENVGIVTSTGKEKIKMQYDNIALVDQDSKLYVVKKNNRFGIIDQNENIIIPISCDSLGVNSKTFENNNIKNSILLQNKIIPVKINDLWALYDKEGNKLTDFVYSGFGCTSSKARNSSSLLIIPDYTVMIGNKNKKYVLINEKGQELLNGMEFDEAYLVEEYDQTNYFVVKDDKTYNAIELLEELKKRDNN
ncbi:MAG: WG repeat-containing protein [Clostridia bacterium]|nr:WG repeat-containing protein [Clostridia bacterium]